MDNFTGLGILSGFLGWILFYLVFSMTASSSVLYSFGALIMFIDIMLIGQNDIWRKSQYCKYCGQRGHVWCADKVEVELAKNPLKMTMKIKPGKCPYCPNLTSIIKYGKSRKGKQIYKCRQCNHRFTML